MIESQLKWSAQLRIEVPQGRRLQGDKITLPQSALESLLAAAPIVTLEDQGTRNVTRAFDPYNPYSYAAEQQARQALSDRQQQLPHPLTFRLVNPQNGQAVYAGIREFSAEEGEVGLSVFLLEALGLKDEATSQRTSRDHTPNGDSEMSDAKTPATVTVHAHQLPKGTYVRLRPLEAGYDPEDWKSLLERYLRDNFTTLTNREILDVPGAKHEHFRFLVDKFEPEGDGICIVDTDLEVDIEALNEEQARETLNRKLAKAKQAPGTDAGSSSGGPLRVGQDVQGQVLRGEYVDYEIKDWNKGGDLEIKLSADDEADIDVLVNSFAARQRSKPRMDEHMFADFSGRPLKRVKLSHTNVDIEEAESLLISVHASTTESKTESLPSQPSRYTLTVLDSSQNGDEHDEGILAEPEVDEVRCKNCQQIIPKRTLPLHEAFCYRNNVACPKCKHVFLKNSEAWKAHWHCPFDENYGNGAASQEKHNLIFHPTTPLRCPACDFEAFNVPILAQHRTSTCPGKEIMCQFCHLIVPQQGPDDLSLTDPEVLLSGMTPHELADGARTTECHLCGKIVRLRDMRTHLGFHDRDRILKPKPKLCINGICGRTIRVGKESIADAEQLGLCDECFGPLHGTSYDPEGKALRRRIERRLLQQLMGGCGKSWCHNSRWCRSGRKNSTGDDVVMTAKDALPVVKPVMDQLARGDATGIRFCIDEAAQSRRAMAEMVSAEEVYDLAWCIKALEEEKNNLSRARDWLKDRAPKKGEVVR